MGAHGFLSNIRRIGGKWRWSLPARWRLPVAALVVVCLPLLGAGWVGSRGASAAEHLTQAATLLRRLQVEMVDGDAPAARDTLARLREQTTAAADRVGDPGWRIGTRLAWVGDDMAAVATVADVLDDLVARGLPDLVEIADRANPAALAPRGGRVRLEPLAEAAPALSAAHGAVIRALAKVEGIDTAGVHPRVRSGVAELRDGLRRAVAMTGTASRTAALLPAVLGARGPRTYLVLFQNLAEPRATGGLPGAFVVVSAHRGAIRIVEQGTATGLGLFERPVLPVTLAMRALYTDRLTTLPADVNFTPHFPTAAALIRQMYRLRTGHAVDGVVATDPVALSYLLRAVGPVGAPGGQRLTARNAVRALLSDVYARFGSNMAQDRYFARVTRTVFGRVTGSPGNPRAMLAEVARAAGERRILAWSARPAEQKLLAGTVLEGSLPVRDGSRPTVGVFLNDGGGSKLGYYLTRRADLSAGRCRADGRRELSVRVTLGSRAPRSGLPRTVLGLGLAGDPYTIRTNVLVFSPAGGTVRDARLDGKAIGLMTGAERGRVVGVVTVDLRPGASRTLHMTVLTAARRVEDAAFAPQLWVTPGITPWTRNVHSPAPC